MTTIRKNVEKKPVTRRVEHNRSSPSTVITVRVSEKEKMRIEKIRANYDITRSDVMRMALQMLEPMLHDN